jgi:2-dehydropantoate 2-reductase
MSTTTVQSGAPQHRDADSETRIAVVGPGAVGATVAAYIHRAGHKVLLCGRTGRKRLEIRPDDGDAIMLPGPVRTDVADIKAPVKLVILSVKATELEHASAWLTVLCDDHTVVCVMQNGVEQIELVQPYCPSSRVVPAIVWFAAEPQIDGTIRLRNTPKVTLPPTAGVAADVLNAAGVVVEEAADFTTSAWQKLMFNAAGALMALTGRRSGMFRRDDIASLTRYYLAECLMVARAEGADLDDDVIVWIVEQYRKYPTDVTSSIRTDREAGRRLEWDTLTGVVLRKARQHGLPAPISEVIVPLLAAASDGPG